MQNKTTSEKISFPQMEEKILGFWQENKIFEKSLYKDSPKGDYVFYDGPPFATGLPHYGHIVGQTIKDVIPRYKTMQGFHVDRKWGWDCHGLPVENLIEKELGLKTKEDIEKMGIDKFNEACELSVMRYASEWKKFIPRMGRWVDMDNDYKTMNPEYMESIWWVFKKLYDKGLIYEGYKSMHLCPRCETTLSNFEVTQGYKDVKDLTVTAKFRLKVGQKIGNFDIDKDICVLAWTTTPWTLPGNVALAVGEDIDYSIVEIKNADNVVEKFILAKERVEKILKDKDYKVVSEVKGKDLLGLEYKPLFPYFNNENTENHKNGWKIYPADFVTTDEGVGIVHIAPAFGDDDMNIGKQYNLPFVQHVKTNGKFVDEVVDFKGQEVKATEDPTKTDIDIIKYLAHNGKLFHKEKYEHSYPHCWRCEAPLLNYATSSWFVKVTEIKDKMIKNNQKINWTPEHMRDGRFGKWLENARDWAISRSRFWGAPLPVWKCVGAQNLEPLQNCKHLKVVESTKELEELSGEKISDLHKQYVDKIKIKCEKCGGEMTRVSEVLDCWFESGSMPYAQKQYTGTALENFDPENGKNFPAQFIAEGVDQTRGWFYTLTVLATALFDKPAFENVIVNGTVLAEDGQKMSKRLKNYPDPIELINKYGADAMRYYLMSSPVAKAGDFSFSEAGVSEVFRKVTMLLWNVYSFYETFADQLEPVDQKKVFESKNILDQWILAKLNSLIEEVTENLENYDMQKASRPILEFINELSTWYLRRSRDRFKFGTQEDKQSALQTINYTLLTLSKLMAPFTPFIAESLYQKVKQKSDAPIGNSVYSVHLEEWPTPMSLDKEQVVRFDLVKNNMEIVMQISEIGNFLRKKSGIKSRQALSTLKYEIITDRPALEKQCVELIVDELNVKEVFLEKVENASLEVSTLDNWLSVESGGVRVSLNTELTTELIQEGLSREITRTINLLRKDAGLSINDKAEIVYQDSIEIKEVFDKYGEDVKRDTLSTSYNASEMDSVELKKEIKIGEKKIWIGIKR